MSFTAPPKCAQTDCDTNAPVCVYIHGVPYCGAHAAPALEAHRRGDTGLVVHDVDLKEEHPT